MSARSPGRLAATGLAGELLLLEPDAAGNWTATTLLDPEAEPAPPLTRYPASFCWPLWTPDGEAILASTIEHAAAGEPPAQLLRRSLETGAIDVLYSNTPGTAPMGAGLPHYVNPSPDGRHVLLLVQAAAGLALIFLDGHGRGPAQPIARGVPLFSAWSPASDAVLLHAGGELSLMELATAPATDVFATNHVGYRVPAWAPDGQGFVVPAAQGRQHSLVLHDRRGKVISSLAPSWSSAVFAWSPDGSTIAQAQSRRSRPQVYTDLQLVSTTKGGVRQPRVPECQAFAWSPSGEHLTVLIPGNAEQLVAWLVLDRDGAPVRRFPAFQPSPEFAVYTAFFDQYALSHPLWSADGSALLSFGRLPFEGPPPELLPSCIYVHDLATGRVTSVAAGGPAFWSSQTL